MAEQTIGRVSVKVTPDTSKFRQEAKAKLDAEERRLPNLNVQLGIKLAKGAAAQISAHAKAARDAAQAALKDLQLRINVDDRGSVQGALARINDEMRKLGQLKLQIGVNDADLKAAKDLIQTRLKNISVKVKVDVDAASLAGAVAQINKELANVKKVDLRVGLNKADVAAAKAALQQTFNNVTATVKVNLSKASTAAVSASLAKLARERTVSIKPVMNKAGLAAISFVSVLSGFDALHKSIKLNHEVLLDLFKDMPQIMGIVPAVLGLAGAFLSGAANVASLAASLAQALPVLLALPGIAIGVTVMVLAFKDFGKVLPGVVSQFKALQPMVSAAFWEQAKGPINDLATVLFPLLRSGLEGTATAVGGFFAAFAGAIQGVIGGGVLEGWFANLNSSIAIFTSFTGPLANIFKIFGDIGSAILPLLAQYMGELATRFSEFMTNLTGGPGGVQAFAEQTMNAFKGIVEFILSIGNVFSGIFTAASAAGAATFQTLTDHLNTFADWLKSPEIQAGMTALFGAAFDMMTNFFANAGPALKSMLTGLGGVLTTVLPQVGTAIGQVAGMIGAIFRNDSAMAGLTAFIQGVLTGVQLLLPAFIPLGALIAALGPTLGTLAMSIGNIFGSLAPSLTGIITAIQPIITLLGDGLAQVLIGISPLLDSLGTMLADVFKGIAPMLGPIIAALMTIISAVVPPLQTFIAAIAPLLVTIVGVLAPIIATVLSAIAPMLVSIVQAATPILTLLTSLIALIAPVLIPVITFLAEIFATALQWAIEGVIRVVRGVIEVLLGVINFVVSIFTGQWGAAWDAIKMIFSGVVDIIVGIIQFIFGWSDAASIWGIIRGGFTKGAAFWKEAWDAISGFLKKIWDDILGAIRGAIDNVVNFFKGLWGKVNGVVSDFRTKIFDFFVSAGGDMARAVVNAIDNVVTFFRELPGKAISGLGDLGRTLYFKGIDIIEGLINGIKSVAGKVLETMKSFVLDKIPDFVKQFFGINSPSRMFMEFGSFLMLGLADGIESEGATVMRALKSVMQDVEGVQFKPPTASLGINPAAYAGAGTQAPGNTLIYNAAPGASLGAEEDLFGAIGRARAFGW